LTSRGTEAICNRLAEQYAQARPGLEVFWDFGVPPAAELCPYRCADLVQTQSSMTRRPGPNRFLVLLAYSALFLAVPVLALAR